MGVSIRSLYTYPIKSCAGIELNQAEVSASGLPWDRRWVLVDAAGNFMTQRVYPRMALIRPVLSGSVLCVLAEGHPDLVIGLDAGCDVVPQDVQVWRSSIPAHRLDDQISIWFSAVLGVSCTLFRVAEPMHRQPDPVYVQRWAESYDTPALTSNGFAFADGFPLLVASQTSLDELNRRIEAQGHAPVPMDRFRPNIVLDGLDAFDEDHIASLAFSGLKLGLVKPCTRCTVPDVDQATGQVGTEPGNTLSGFRRFDSGVLFGQNAIVAMGAGAMLSLGDQGEFDYAF